MQQEVSVFSDADWAQDILDRKSISRMLFIMGGGAVCWTSKKQPSVALSSVEAEYLVLCLTVRHSLWITQLLKMLSLTIPIPVIIQCDNQGVISVVKDPQQHGKMKHIDLHHHFI